MSTGDERLDKVGQSIDEAKKAAADVADRGAVTPDDQEDVNSDAHTDVHREPENELVEPVNDPPEEARPAAD